MSSPYRGQEPGIKETVVSLKDSGIGYIQSKAELAMIEAQEAAAHAKKKISVGAVTAFLGFFTYALFLVIAIGGLNYHFGQKLASLSKYAPSWLIITAGFFGIHLFFLLIYLLRLKKKSDQEFFAFTKAELQKDKQWLKEMNKGN